MSLPQKHDPESTGVLSYVIHTAPEDFSAASHTNSLNSLELYFCLLYSREQEQELLLKVF